MRSSKNTLENDNSSKEKGKKTPFRLNVIDDYRPDDNKQTLSSSIKTIKEKVVGQMQQIATKPKPHHPRDPLSFSTFLVMDGIKHPVKNRPASNYKKVSKNPTLSFHTVDKVIKQETKKAVNPIRFFKHNPQNSLMSELEAVCCAFFRLIAPHNAPSARAHYDSNNVYVGLSSKGIPGFKSTKEDPLKEEDLIIKPLDSGDFTIPELDELDSRAYQDGYILDSMSDDQVIFEEFINANGNNKNRKAFVTVKDLKNYRMVKGQGIGLTTSYILGEDDCHRGNISKYGIRIDFDMTLWWFLCHFKESGIVDWTFRFPNESTFIVTSADILHFPNFVHADPFYWPTKPPKILGEPLRSFVAKMLPISENAYEVQDNSVFQKLETHPVFIYHKFATLLKFILTDTAMYRNLAKLYLREELTIESRSILDMLCEHLANRIAAFKNVLLKMPEFYQYLNTVDAASQDKYGDVMLNNILEEFEERNQKLEKKVAQYPQYKDNIISIPHIKEEYESFMKKAKLLHEKKSCSSTLSSSENTNVNLEDEFTLILADDDNAAKNDKKAGLFK